MAEWYRAKFTDARGRNLLNAWLATFLLGPGVLLFAVEFSWWSAALLALTGYAAAYSWITWARSRQRS